MINGRVVVNVQIGDDGICDQWFELGVDVDVDMIEIMNDVFFVVKGFGVGLMLDFLIQEIYYCDDQ